MSIRVLVNLFLDRDAVFAQAAGLTEEEHARVREAKAEARRRGEDEKRAGLDALIATGKVHTIHCGSRAAEHLRALTGKGAAA